MNNPNWMERSTDPCLAYILENNNRIATKGVAKCDFPIEEVCKFLWNVESMLKLSPMLKEVKIIK